MELTSTLTLFFFLTTTLAIPTSPSYFTRSSAYCAPGGNLDLSKWTLQLPTGTQGHIDQVSGAKLATCSGYTNPKYFFTTLDASSVTLKVPGSPDSSGCVTTSGSKHCRTELREASPNSWNPKASTNRLIVRLAVPQPDDSKYGTVIGQIHVDDKVSSKPVCELFYNKDGKLSIGVEQIPNESSLKVSDLNVTVKTGETFQYEIRYEGGKLSVGINDRTLKEFGTGSLNGPKSYFKVGNYNQGSAPSEVVIHSIDVQHS